MICPYCNKQAAFVDNIEIYGKRYGKSYMMYWCKSCDALCGVHDNDPTRPLGSMANKELRLWRRKAHEIIDPFWKLKLMKRGHVYARLKRHFGFEVHMGGSDVALCKRIVAEAPQLLVMSKAEFFESYPKQETL